MHVKTVKKYNIKSLSWLKAKATLVFNKFIRERDSQDGYFTCISCNNPKMIKNYAHGSNYHAGHFHSGGNHPELKFNEFNVNGQCDHCNKHLHGNLINYEINLIKKIGHQQVILLQNTVDFHKRKGYKWDRFFLISIIEKYKS